MDKRVPHRILSGYTIPTLVLALVVGTSSAACFPDYDRFRDVEAVDNNATNNDVNNATNNDVNNDSDVGNNMPMDTGDGGDVDMPGDADVDMNDADVDMPDDADVDMNDADVDMNDADVDMNDADADVEDEQPPALGLGTACNDDSDCEGNLICQSDFDNGLCTRPCNDDSACPASAVCGADVGMPFCLLTCEVSCAAVRPFECVEWRGGRRVCVSDDDLDGALNSIDNCPENVFNPDQIDSDGDGDGDLCDSDAFCPSDAPGNLREAWAVELDAPPRPLVGGGLVHIAPLGQMLYLGGVDAEGNSLAEVTSYDRVSGQWASDLPPLPYPARGVAATYDTLREEVVATPGDDAAFTRLLILPLDRDYANPVGQWRSGPTLPRPLYKAQISYLFPHYIAIMGFSTDDAQAADAELLAYVYDRRTSALTLLDTDQMVTQGRIGPLSLIAVKDGKFYGLNTWERDLVYRIDPKTLSFGAMLHPETGTPVPASGPFVSAIPVPPPVTGVPIVGTSTNSRYLYYIRLDGGDAQRVDLYNEINGVVAPMTGFSNFNIPPVDGLILENVTIEGDFIAETRSAFVLTTSNTNPMTTATEYFLLCATISTGIDIDDNDADELSSLRDNCPLSSGPLRNPQQEDLDLDGIGDVCDDDIDGDDIPNEMDFVVDGLNMIDQSRDQDNDGIPDAADLDDDGDRIVDGQDLFLSDTDNDGIPNWADDDDDDDGFSDSAERSAGSNPHDWVSIPGGERVTAVFEANGRRLVVSTLSGMADAYAFDGVDYETLDTGDAVASAPRLADRAPWLLYSDLANPAAPALRVQSLEPVNDALPPAIVVTPEGFVGGEAAFASVDPSPEVLVIRKLAGTLDPPGPDMWSIDRLVEDVDMNLLAEIDNVVPAGVFPRASLAAGRNDTYVFTQGIEGCTICEDLYLFSIGEAASRLALADTGVGEFRARIRGGWGAALFVANAGDYDRAFLLEDGAQAPSIVSPEGWEVKIADFAQSSNRVLLIARPVGDSGPFGLYIFEVSSGRFLPLSLPDIDVLDVDFSR